MGTALGGYRMTLEEHRFCLGCGPCPSFLLVEPGVSLSSRSHQTLTSCSMSQILLALSQLLSVRRCLRKLGGVRVTEPGTLSTNLTL